VPHGHRGGSIGYRLAQGRQAPQEQNLQQELPVEFLLELHRGLMYCLNKNSSYISHIIISIIP
jgi:hypothetical protein